MSRNTYMRRSMLAELLEGQPALKKRKSNPSVPISTLMLDGQRALDEKRYQNAVEHFSHAIDSLVERKADLLHVYDLRSGAYIKLSQIQNSLKDAKHMIRLDRADERGYLRCAQVEQLSGNSAGAIKVCEYGLKSIASSTKGHARLEACLNRLQESAKESIVLEKGTDPMGVLPTELLDIVMESFDYRQVIAIMRVSKGWRSRLRSSDIVTQTIDTRQSRRTVTYEQIKAAFTRLGKTPKSLTLARLNETAARFAGSELNRWFRWSTLETLVVDEGKIHLANCRFEKYTNLKNLSIGPGVEVHKPTEVLAKCPSLQHFDLRGTLTYRVIQHSWSSNPNLRSLSICPLQDEVIQLELPPYAFPFPNIEEIELGNMVLRTGLDLSKCSKLKELSLRNASIHEQHNLRTPPSLQRFVLDGPFAMIFPHPEEIKMPASNLHTISVKGSDSIRCLAYAIRQCLNKAVLRNVSISDFITYSNILGRHISSDLNLLRSTSGIEALENVDTLALKDDNIKDTDLTVINSLFPSFRHLDLEAPEITEVFVSELLRLPGTKVQTITLRNCSKVSTDVIKWSKLRKVDVRLVRQSKPDDVFGGRRVRY